MRRWIIAIALAIFLGGPTGAAAGPECSCRYKGRDVPVGGQVCLNTPQGMRIATCGFELNNTSWKFSKRSCNQVAGRTPPIGQSQSTAFLEPGRVSLPASKPLLSTSVSPW